MSIFTNDTVSAFLLNSKYRRTRYILLLIVLIVIALTVALDNMHSGDMSSQDVGVFFTFILLFGVFPLNALLLVPHYLLKNRPVAYFVCVLLLITLMLMIIAYLQIQISFEGDVFEEMKSRGFWISLISSFISMGLFISGTAAILLLRYWIKTNNQINELESTTLQSELDMLKSQINPHFLLNMLNNVNVLIWKNKEEAQRVSYKLEDLLRYQLNGTYEDKVLLSSDISFLNDFLNLEKIRRDKFEFEIIEHGSINNVMVPSLLFIPFVENAVKHNPDNNNLSYVRIRFDVHGDELDFYCENSKPVNEPIRKKSGGLGLKNIQRRLELLYPDSHVLEIVDEETKYTIRLKLIL